VSVSIGRCRQEGGPGFRLDQPDDWLGLVASRCNILVTGPDAATEAFVLATLPILRAPVQRISCENGLTLGDAPATLVLRHVHTLSAAEQQSLLHWLDSTSNGRTQVMSLSSAPLFSLVAAGVFDELLYYRLNLIFLQVTAD